MYQLNVPHWSLSSEHEHRSPHKKILLLFSGAFCIFSWFSYISMDLLFSYLAKVNKKVSAEHYHLRVKLKIVFQWKLLLYLQSWPLGSCVQHLSSLEKAYQISAIASCFQGCDINRVNEMIQVPCKNKPAIPLLEQHKHLHKHILNQIKELTWLKNNLGYYSSASCLWSDA